jgi:hypothetical protein
MPIHQVAAPPPAAEGSDADDGLSGGLLDLVAEDELTEEERITNEAWTAECAAHRRQERRANRRGIAIGVAAGIGLIGLLHLAGVRVGTLPFARFGGHHWISLTRPATTTGWFWELAGTFLMFSSLAILKARWGLSWVSMRHIYWTIALTLVPYLAGALCLGIAG